MYLPKSYDLSMLLTINCYVVHSITDGRDRIHIKVDSDLTAFLAKGNDTIFVNTPKIRTAYDLKLWNMLNL